MLDVFVFTFELFHELIIGANTKVSCDYESNHDLSIDYGNVGRYVSEGDGYDQHCYGIHKVKGK